MENKLYELTRIITEKKFNKERQNGGFLGGEWGYGVDFENDIFMMHPFCWCDKEDCGWCSSIGIMPQVFRDIARVKYSESDRLPNFFYKPTGGKIWWYKYIGRGMEKKGNFPKDWFDKCVSSLEQE